ncbi:MAG: putative metal-dependent hydrolase [Gammaproteobacteria bacterium]|jgi:predicted metal-dependent hydrolase
MSRSATIKVEEGVAVVVVVRTLTQERIQKLLDGKKLWIQQKIALYPQTQVITEKQYISGEAFSYLGRNYRLKVIEGELTPLKLVQGRLTMSAPKGSSQSKLIKYALTSWFRRRAELKLREKIMRYSPIVGVQTNGYKVKEFQSRWGSCTSSGRVDLNWKIIMAPNRVVDYVVVHELCHLKQHDHSPQFWKLVESIMPDYLESKEWLRVHGASLMV